MSARYVIYFILILHTVAGDQPYMRDGIIDRLNSGMQFAKDLLSSESVAQKVAEFVVKAFQNVNQPTSPRRKPLDSYVDETSKEENLAQDNRPNFNVNEAPSPMTPLRHLVRLFGLQPNQISAVAVNAIVFVAQMISTFLAGPKPPERPQRSDDPLSWILNKNSRKLQEIITTAKNESLPNIIEEYIKEQGSEDETSCIRLLICKVKPFVNKMQDVVFGSSKNENFYEHELKGAASMYRHLPTSDEIKRKSDICERQHRECDLD